MRKLALIPARGGSKRIPRKNCRAFAGRPIITHVIETVIQSGLFDTVMVSTDDAEIAQIAIQSGAEVPFMRSEENATDTASTLSVIREVMQMYAEQGQHFDAVCCIYPTAVLTTAAHLVSGWQLLQAKHFDSVFPVVAYSHPVWRGFELHEEKAVMLWPEHQQTRTQDLSVVYHDAGQWYWMYPNRIKDRIFTPNSGTIVLRETEVQDIDSEEDWQLALLKYTLSKH